MPLYFCSDVSSNLSHTLFAFLATIVWSKDCAITGTEGLMSSGPLTNVAGTLFRMRTYFAGWSCPHKNLASSALSTSLPSHLSEK